MIHFYRTIYKISIFFLISGTCLHSQNPHKNLRDGDKLYEFGKFNQAETEYRRADLEKPSLKSSYNLANTLMNQDRYEEALKKYDDAGNKAVTDIEKAKVFYNQGNAFFKKNQFKESIESYKKSLQFNAGDNEAKENLALAQYELKKQVQQQKKENNEKNNKNQNKNDKNDKTDKDSKEQSEQKGDRNDKDNLEKEKQNESVPTEGKLSKEDAQKLLEIMNNEEKKVQQKLRRIDGKSKPSSKDW